MKGVQENTAEQPALMDAPEYLPFVRKVAARVTRRLPPSVCMDELVSAGTIGLMEALQRYEQGSKRSFETYAEFRIKGAIMDELRRHDPIKTSGGGQQRLKSASRMVGGKPAVCAAHQLQ